MAIAEVDVQAARQQLERILASPGFARNARLSGFLRFVVEKHLAGRDDEIKESVIAVEVLGRKPDYDPKQDSIVRTEAARLRARLTEYYRGQGRHDSWIVELPKGAYTPVFLPGAREAGPGEAEARAVPVPAPPPPPRSRSPRWIMAALALFAIGTALIIRPPWRLQPDRAIPIAVLPLLNLSHDPANDYFTDALTGEIIRDLSIIDGLAVRSQTSSFVFKGKSASVREAGKQLSADYILEGSVLRDGERLRINAQLVRVRDDVALWSGRFDRRLDDVMAIQDEISRGIVNSLRLKLGAGRRRYETSVAAYDQYLRARALPIQRGLPGWLDSVGPFEQAIEADPSFAPAWAGLATAHADRSAQFAWDADEERKKMRAAVQKAIELDPLLPEAHAALGLVCARDGQWEQAEKALRRAIELDPNQSMSHQWYAMELLLPLGRYGEALAQLRAAARTDPLSPDVQFFFYYVLSAAKRFDDAEPHCHSIRPGFYAKAWCEGEIQMRHGKADEAVRTYETAAHAGGWQGSEIHGLLGCAYVKAGRRGDAEKLATSESNPFNQARIYACLGDKDRTFESLDQAASRGPFRIGRALTWPEMSLLLGDSRLKSLRKNAGLPD